MIGPDGLSDFWRFLNLPQSLDQQAPKIGLKTIFEFLKYHCKFDSELLSSQTTHWNELILDGKVLSWWFQKVQNHFCGLSGSWAIRDQRRSISSRFFKNNKNSWFFKITIKLIDFDRELLSSQTTHQNGFVLSEILRARPFYRVLYHFGGLSVSRKIC